MEETFDCYKLSLTDTLTGEKREFTPRDKVVTLYVCGITPYDYAHIGHGRCYVTFDVLYRLLQFLDYDVIYARNYTDIDDKLIARAQKEFSDPNRYGEIAKKFIGYYKQDMESLNCLPPNYEPLVTENIDEIIKFIQGLIDNKKAYVIGNDVYYNIESFKPYGELSKRNTEDLLAGARTEVRQEKQNPLDFALWKSAHNGPGWDSPWGYGRPGWHIECSALSKKFLGQTIDIHAGGMDLIFPHHENEKAQSEGLTGKQFVRFWLHNAFVNINKEKMSKSLGNFVILKDLFEQFDPMVIRYYFIVHHYRSPIEFSPDDVQASAKSYAKLCRFFSEFSDDPDIDPCCDDMSIFDDLMQALCDDLNIAKFFGIIFENLKKLEKDETQASLVKIIIQHILGLTLEEIEEEEQEVTPEIQELIDQRERARKEKNWEQADKIRDKLLELGYAVKDSKIN